MLRSSLQKVMLKFYAVGLWLLVFVGTVPQSMASNSAPGDGRIRLYNYHLNEFIEVTYRHGDQYLAEAQASLQKLFRSRNDQQEHAMAWPLIELLDQIQDHFQADTIEIISAYRSADFNESLRQTGHQVSPVSFHIKGLAADIHVDEVTEETLRDFVQQLKKGGVGYYGSLDFVHVDLGPVRQWSEAGPVPRKLIGILQKQALPQLHSDKNDYRVGETIKWQWQTKPDVGTLPLKALQLEHFFRGQWQPIGTIHIQTLQAHWPLSTNNSLFQNNGKPRYGKYRWTFQLAAQKEPFSSNEFYLKKY